MTMVHRVLRSKAKRRRAAALALACVSAVSCLRVTLAPPIFLGDDVAFGGTASSFGSEDLFEEDDDEDEARMHRFLLRTLDQSHLMDGFHIVDTVLSGEDSASSLHEEGGNGHSSPIGTNNQTFAKSLTSYTLEDAMNEADVWRFSFAGEFFILNLCTP